MEDRAMALSRRKFTPEFKAEVLRRLELGASVAEVAGTCELNPSVLHRWRRERRENGEKAFPGWASGEPRKAGCRNWSGTSVSNLWKSIFCGAACSGSKSSGSRRR